MALLQEQTLTLSMHLAVLFLPLKTMALSTTEYPSTTTLTSTTWFQTTTPPVCMLWGTIPKPDLRPGEEKTISCERCYCDLNYQAQCMRAMCTTPAYCTNPVLRPGECCPYCEIRMPTTTLMLTTTPQGCVLGDGIVLRPGERIVSKMPGFCRVQYCNGNMLDPPAYGDCFPAMCVDAQESECCQYCPNGQNCRLPNGSLLYGSNPQVIDGMLCQCPEPVFMFGAQTEQLITAVCIPSNLTTT